MSDQQSSSVLNHMAKFFIVTSNRNSQVGRIASTFFSQVGIINFGLLYEKDMEVSVEVSNHFTSSTTVLRGTSLEASGKNSWKGISSKIFPDKLQNLNGYTYKVAYHHGMSFANYRYKNSHNLKAKNKYFFETVAKLQNANVTYLIINRTESKPLEDKLSNMIRKRQIDATLSESMLSGPSYKNIWTYDEHAVCAMIPYSMNLMNFVMKFSIFVEDLTARLYIIFLFLLTLLVWRLYKGHGAIDSITKIFFVIYAYYIGNHMPTSPNNRMVLQIMLQVIMFAMFFIRTLSECRITSEIIDIKPAKAFQTIDDILTYDGSNKAISSSAKQLLSYLNKQPTDTIRGNYSIKNIYRRLYKEIKGYSADEIVISRCDYLDHYIRSGTSTHYILPQHFFSHFIKLDVGYLSPFTERFQDMMNHAFDTGLTQKWETYYLTEMFGSRNENLRSYTKNTAEGHAIGFYQFKRFFKIMLCIYGGAAIILLCEIFWHSFLSKLSWTIVLKLFEKRQRTNGPRRWKFIRRIRRMLHFWRRQRRIVNVRRIQVRPIEV